MENGKKVLNEKSPQKVDIKLWVRNLKDHIEKVKEEPKEHTTIKHYLSKKFRNNQKFKNRLL